MSRNTIASIDLSAIAHNLGVVRRLAPHSQIASVVKADGYGHGITRVAQALQASDLLAVATSGEANRLRAGGWAGRLLMLEGFASPEELDLALSLGSEMVIHQYAQIEMIRQRRLAPGCKLWLKIDSGMHRLGFPSADTAAVYTELGRLAGPDAVILMTHFACADEPFNPMTDNQIKRFDEVTAGLHAEQSLANSAAVLNFPRSHRDIVRPGILLYGISPDPNRTAGQIGLKPAMTLSTQLIAVNRCSKGESVGYAAAYACPEDMRIGVAAIGYGDGYPRHLRNGTPVLVNGRPAVLAGRVSMDLITLDLRGHDDARIGDPVVLWGAGLGAETVSPWAESVPYEMICGVTGRVPRVTV